MGACCSSSKKPKRPNSTKLAPLYSTLYFGSTIDILHTDITDSIRADVLILFTLQAKTIISASYPTAKKDLKNAIEQKNDLILTKSTFPFFTNTLFVVVQSPTEQEVQDGLIHALRHSIEQKFITVAIPELLYEQTKVKPTRYPSIVMTGLAYCCEDDSGLSKIKLMFKDQENAMRMKDEFGGDIDVMGDEADKGKLATPRKVKIEISDDDYHVSRMSEYTKKKNSMHSRNASAAGENKSMFRFKNVPVANRFKYIRPYILLKNTYSLPKVRSKFPSYKLHPTHISNSDVLNPNVSRTPWVNCYIPLRTIKPGPLKKFIKKSNWASAKAFSLAISPQDISDDFFRIIKVSMIKMMSLKTLRLLEIELDLSIISDEVVILVLRKITSIQKLVLKSTTTMDDGGLAELSRKFIGFVRLQTLDLQLRGYIIPIGYWIKVLGESLSNLKSFKTLRLSLELVLGESYTEKNMFSNLLGLKNLENVPELELNLTIVNYAAGPNADALFQVLKQLKNLTKLLMEFIYSTIDATLILAMSSVVQMLPKITHFSFLSEDCENLSPNSYSKFADAIRQVNRLTSLKFHLQTNGVINPDVPFKLSDSLMKLFNFQNLDLKLSQGNYQANFIQTFINFSNLKLLQTVKLDFVKGNKLSDNVLSVLTKAITQFIQASEMSLNFSGCDGITDNGLTSLATNLPLNLKRLNINLAGITTFSDEGFLEFTKRVQVLMNLRSLELNCNKCLHIGNNGLNALANCISKLNYLDTIAFAFNNCPLIEDAGLNVLGNSLGAMKFLYEVSLSLNGCESLTRDAIFMLAATLAEARVLRRIDLMVVTNSFSKNDEGFLHAILEKAPSLIYVALNNNN